MVIIPVSTSPQDLHLRHDRLYRFVFELRRGYFHKATRPCEHHWFTRLIQYDQRVTRFVLLNAMTLQEIFPTHTLSKLSVCALGALDKSSFNKLRGALKFYSIFTSGPHNFFTAVLLFVPWHSHSLLLGLTKLTAMCLHLRRESSDYHLLCS